MKQFGLIGFPLSHSFSKKYYLDKFEREGIADAGYDLYPIERIEELPALLEAHPQLAGINVTIPHKISVMAYIDHLADEARAIQAVNCITIDRRAGDKPVLAGYNTDVYGFEQSLKPLLQPHQQQALVLGNGGAAKAVFYALGRLDITYKTVSRNPAPGQLGYDELTDGVMASHTLIINTTPLGTYPNVAGCPDIPYAALTDRHLLYDLVYNPEVTEFLRRGQAQGAAIKNGMEMLVLQAERNWEIWNGLTPGG